MGSEMCIRDRDNILTITLNRPEALNAFNTPMLEELLDACDRADADDNVKAIIVTGAGRAFCAGADLSSGGKTFNSDARAVRNSGINPDGGGRLTLRLYELNKPIIAAINGAAAGVGLALAAFADIRFAVPKAKLTTAHGKLNLPAEYGLSWVLPRIVGLGRANDLLLTSRVFLSEEAEKIGFVNQLFSSEQLINEAEEYARELVKNISPDSLRQTRWQIYRDQHDAVARSVEKSEELLESMMKDEDFREGVRALVEKRSPRWKE